MSPLSRRVAGKLLLGCTLLMAFAAPAMPQQTLPSETPATFVPRVESFDYSKREEMIPMRDGVKLKTVILIPRGAHRAPILLTRTPYGATSRIAKDASAHLDALLDSNDVADDAVLNGGYIRVLQDVRGKHGSEGDYVMTRPLHGPLNPTAVDHSTDTYDTIDWLVKNIPGDQRQGRHSRHFLRWLHLADGAGESASGAARGDSNQCHGRWLDGR